MKNQKMVMIGAIVIFLVGMFIGDYAVQLFRQVPDPSPETQSLIGTPVPEFSLLGLDGVREKNSQWIGKVQVINFWATWCPPCKREIPALIELQNDYRNFNLQVIGIARDDKDAVMQFVNEAGINYPILLGDDDVIEVAELLGNDLGVLPYTVITDQAGNIAFIKYGEMDRETIENEIKKYLQ